MKNGDAPAYPGEYKNNDGTTDFEPGLTKREKIAAMAMQGMLANPECFKAASENIPADAFAAYYATAAVEQADALLIALES